jgi:hypothetical protein
LNIAILTIGAQYFQMKSSGAKIAAVIDYLAVCHEQKESNFDFEQSVQENLTSWPRFVSQRLTRDSEWTRELTNLAFGRISRQENHQCAVVAAVSPDSTFLHHSAVLLLQNNRFFQAFFIAAASSDLRLALAELKRLLTEQTVGGATKVGFFNSFFRESIAPIPIVPIVLNVLSVIASNLPYSHIFVDVIMAAFNADQSATFLNDTWRAIENILAHAPDRQIIHHLIERMIGRVTTIDFPAFESALVNCLDRNQVLGEELSVRLSNLIISWLTADLISQSSGIEAAFLDANYAEVTEKPFFRALEGALLSDFYKESLYRSMERTMRLKSDLTFFQRFYRLFVPNVLSPNLYIREFCLTAINNIDSLRFEFPKNWTADSVFEQLTIVSNFFKTFRRKFSFESSFLLGEMLIDSFSQVGESGQLSISLFMWSVFEQFPREYISQSRRLILVYLIAIRKTGAFRSNLSFSVYLNTLIILLKADATAFIPILFESGVTSHFPHRISRQLFNIIEFVDRLFEYILSFLNQPPASISVECVARVTQILSFFLDERLSDEIHGRAILSFLALVTVTSATFPRWTDTYRQSHIHQLETVARQILESHANDGPLLLSSLGTLGELATIITFILRKIQYQIPVDVLQSFDARYPHAKAIILAFLCQRDSSVFPELTLTLSNPEIVTHLSQILPWLSPVFDLQMLKESDPKLIHTLLIASLETIALPSIFPIFLKLLLVCDSDTSVNLLQKIFIALNNAIRSDPQLLSQPDFNSVLFRLLDLCKSPAQLVTTFDIICLKMAEWLVSDSQKTRSTGELFFCKLFSSSDLDCVFSSLVSVFTTADGSPERYSRIADTIVKSISSQTIISADDLEIVAKIVRPLALLNDRRITVAFVKILENAVAVQSAGKNLDKILELLGEFESPWLGRMQLTA